MADTTDGLTPADLAGERAEELPAREVMTLISPTSGTAVLPGLDPTAASGTDTTPTPADGAAGTAGSTAGDVAQFTPPPSDGAYSPAATSSSTT